MEEEDSSSYYTSEAEISENEEEEDDVNEEEDDDYDEEMDTAVDTVPTAQSISTQPDTAMSKMTETFLGGLGYTEFFLACAKSLQAEEVIKRSPKGKRVNLVLEQLYTMNEKTRKLTDVAVLLVSRIVACANAGSSRKLPSAKSGAIWATFHQLRSNHDIKTTWARLAEDIPDYCRADAPLTLQLLLDRLLKKAIHNQAESTRKHLDMSVADLNAQESNAVRYMAGFVAVKLLRKFQKPSKSSQDEHKRELFVAVLKSMRASGQPGEPETVLEYSTLWSELIDRGGLYHINDEVFKLMESIELVSRRYLNVNNLHGLASDTDVHKLIMDDVLKSDTVLGFWERVTQRIPSKYEEYSIELLRHVLDLWITIRGHSFAKSFTTNFIKKQKKGTRKSLQEKK